MKICGKSVKRDCVFFWSLLLELFFLLGHLITSFLPYTSRSVDCLLYEPGLKPQSLEVSIRIIDFQTAYKMTSQLNILGGTLRPKTDEFLTENLFSEKIVAPSVFSERAFYEPSFSEYTLSDLYTFPDQSIDVYTLSILHFFQLIQLPWPEHGA